MFDFISHQFDEQRCGAPVLLLSGPFGVAREWQGITLCLGTRGEPQVFDDRAEWRSAVEVAPDGAHLVAYGPAAYDALRVAMVPGAARSITLIDPDIIMALPELGHCLQFRGQTRMIRRAVEIAGAGHHADAARSVIDWWMGRRAWSRTSARLQARFAGRMLVLAAEWERQAAEPFDLFDLTAITVPVKVVTGRRAPHPVRALAQMLGIVVPGLSRCGVKGAGTAAHLTDAHIVAPEVSNFVVSSDRRWQNLVQVSEAA